jgi:hypothetical protein
LFQDNTNHATVNKIYPFICKFHGTGLNSYDGGRKGDAWNCKGKYENRGYWRRREGDGWEGGKWTGLKRYRGEGDGRKEEKGKERREERERRGRIRGERGIV